MANQFLFVQARRISSADNKAVIRHESVLSLGGGWEWGWEEKGKRHKM